MGLISEFKDFAVKGNVIDMAVGIVVGGAFKSIVTSFVGDIVMPAVGTLTGGIDLSEHKLPLVQPNEAEGVEGVYMGIGTFANTIIDFIIIAFAIFMVVKMINSAKKKEESKPTPPPKQEVLLEEIRDLLAKQ